MRLIDSQQLTDSLHWQRVCFEALKQIKWIHTRTPNSDTTLEVLACIQDKCNKHGGGCFFGKNGCLIEKVLKDSSGKFTVLDLKEYRKEEQDADR